MKRDCSQRQQTEHKPQTPEDHSVHLPQGDRTTMSGIVGALTFRTRVFTPEAIGNPGKYISKTSEQTADSGEADPVDLVNR